MFYVGLSYLYLDCFLFLMIQIEVKKQTSELENNLYRNTIMFNVMNKEYDSIRD